MAVNKVPAVVLISGSGSNLQAIIDAGEKPDYPVEVVAVISNIPDVKGLERARKAGINTEVLSHKDFACREDFDTRLAGIIDSYNPEIVILAGFMRILTEAFVTKYEGRMLNIHPSLLPKYRGLDTHQRAIEAGESHHGATVHFVTAELDGGPLILQAQVALEANDTVQQLAGRILEKEHIIYPRAIGWVGEKRVQMQNGKTVFDGQVLDKPLLLENIN